MFHLGSYGTLVNQIACHMHITGDQKSHEIHVLYQNTFETKISGSIDKTHPYRSINGFDQTGLPGPMNRPFCVFWVGSNDPLGKVLQMIRTHPKGNRLEHALN